MQECASLRKLLEEAALLLAQRKQASEGDRQKKKGKKPKIEESARWDPTIGGRANSPVIMITHPREIGQTDAVEAAPSVAPSIVVLATVAPVGGAQGSRSRGSHRSAREVASISQPRSSLNVIPSYSSMVKSSGGGSAQGGPASTLA